MDPLRPTPPEEIGVCCPDVPKLSKESSFALGQGSGVAPLVLECFPGPQEVSLVIHLLLEQCDFD